MRFNTKNLNKIPKERYNLEFKAQIKKDILNNHGPYIPVDADDLTPFELENIINENMSSGTGNIQFRNNNENHSVNNNLNQNNSSSNVKNNINLPAVN